MKKPKRLYDDQRWRKARKAFLSDPEHCLCVMCEREGRDVPATVIDHIKPHHNDPALFWKQSNWQSLCTAHHNSTKQLVDIHGTHAGCDSSGNPTDPNHYWNKVKK